MIDADRTLQLLRRDTVLGDTKGVSKFAFADCDQNARPPYPSNLAGVPPIGTDYPALRSVGGYGVALALAGVL